MDYPDPPTTQRDLEEERQRVGELGERALYVGCAMHEPVSARHHVVVGCVTGVLMAVDHHLLVVSAHGVEPGRLEQLEAFARVRPAVHQIADRDEPVPGGVEAEVVERVHELLITAVEVADEVILTSCVVVQNFQHGASRIVCSAPPVFAPTRRHQAGWAPAGLSLTAARAPQCSRPPRRLRLRC